MAQSIFLFHGLCEDDYSGCIKRVEGISDDDNIDTEFFERARGPIRLHDNPKDALLQIAYEIPVLELGKRVSQPYLLIIARSDVTDRLKDDNSPKALERLWRSEYAIFKPHENGTDYRSIDCNHVKTYLGDIPDASLPRGLQQFGKKLSA